MGGQNSVWSRRSVLGGQEPGQESGQESGETDDPKLPACQHSDFLHDGTANMYESHRECSHLDTNLQGMLSH